RGVGRGAGPLAVRRRRARDCRTRRPCPCRNPPCHRGRGPRHHHRLSAAAGRAAMNRLRFLLARSLRDDSALATLSVPQAELLAAAAGRDIALVGNARALSTQRHGAAIDSAGLVVRINRAPMPAPESHGTRTDWLAL